VRWRARSNAQRSTCARDARSSDPLARPRISAAIVEARDDLERDDGNGLTYPPAGWILGVAFAIPDSPRLAQALADARVSTRWLQAARAIVEGEWVRAADLVAPTGLGTAEAGLRLRAAEEFVSAGRVAEANEQLERALAFYWRAGATLYLRRAEALMAVSA
jgi:hypothetical protein